MEFDKIPTTLNVTLYGNMEQVSDVMSKCRVRIFYKGMNRNRTYISEDFANQLISSLAYVPVKGIFSKEDVDFTDHGEDNTDGKIYGIVPADSNFAWEDHMDDDGVVRSYACADVLLFTGLYPEAKLIPTESQSMEIFRGNLKGEWRISEEDKQPYYYFMKGCLVGLQVLGMDTEPCFEGAAFFSHINPDEIKVLVDYIRNTTSKKEEIKTMDKTLFRISDNQKSMMIESLANPNFNEEGGWVQDRIVIDVYDDYALSINLKGGYERVYYAKDGDEVSLGEIVPVSIVDVTESEYAALEAMKSLGGYEAANTAYTESTEKVASLESEKAEFESKVSALETKVSELETKISENETTIADYTAKVTSLESEKVEMEKNLSDITVEKDSLVAFKKGVEKERKEAILTKYEEYLSESAVAQFQTNMDNFSVEDFKKEVCTAAVEADSTIFANRHNEPEMFYKGGNPDEGKIVESPVVRLLNNYKNGGSK